MKLFGFEIRRIGYTQEEAEVAPAISESHKRLSAFFPELQKAALDSEEHYDQKVFTISAGAIGLELSILQFFSTQPRAIIWVIISVSAFVFALLLNLIVHYFAKLKQDKQSDAIRSFLESDKDDDSFIYNMIRKDNNTIRRINVFSIAFVFAGIACLAIFTFTNLLDYGF